MDFAGNGRSSELLRYREAVRISRAGRDRESGGSKKIPKKI